MPLRFRDNLFDAPDWNPFAAATRQVRCRLGEREMRIARRES